MIQALPIPRRNIFLPSLYIMRRSIKFMLFTGLTSLIVVFLPISNASTLLNAQNPYVVPTDD